MGTWWLSNLFVKFPQSVERVKSVASVQYLRGVDPGVTARSKCLVVQHELIEILAGSAT